MTDTPIPAETLAKVARAIHEARYGSDYPAKLRADFDYEYEDGKEYCKRLAQAAITALGIDRLREALQALVDRIRNGGTVKPTSPLMRIACEALLASREGDPVYLLKLPEHCDEAADELDRRAGGLNLPPLDMRELDRIAANAAMNTYQEIERVIAAVRAALARADRIQADALRDALETYGNHQWDCGWDRTSHGECQCGWSQFRAALSLVQRFEQER